MELLVAFVLGMIAMDALWAFRLGIPQYLWHRFKNRNNPQPTIEQE